jgi:hypothetical protein
MRYSNPPTSTVSKRRNCKKYLFFLAIHNLNRLKEKIVHLFALKGLVDGVHRCNLVLATVQGAKDSWAVVTDEPPTLQTLWQYALR